MPIRMLQGLLVVGAMVWAILPRWGSFVFGGIYLLMVLTVLAKRRAARKKLAAHAEQLAGSLAPEAVQWAQQHPLFYVWPEVAKAWGLTMKMASLVMIVLSLWFVARGIFFLQPWVWAHIVPATFVFFVGVSWGGRLDLDVLLTEEKWAPKKALHDEVKKVLTLQSLAGKWAPGEPG